MHHALSAFEICILQDSHTRLCEAVAIAKNCLREVHEKLESGPPGPYIMGMIQSDLAKIRALLEDPAQIDRLLVKRQSLAS
jgi:hypothetical protein